MILSFLIVNWNGGNVFENAIKSIVEEAERYFEPNLYEIIVVDNNSVDLNKQAILINDRVKLIRNRENTMFSIGTNQTVAAAAGKFLFLLNNDIIFQPGCLKPLLEKIQEPGIDAVVPRLINMDNSIQRSVRSFPTINNILYSATGLSCVHSAFDTWKMSNFDYGKEQFVDQPMFSALLLKRETWEKVGELDENLPLLFNDVDWFKRFSNMGLKCKFVPDANLYHVHGMSVNRKYYKKVLESSRSMDYYFRKHLFPSRFNYVKIFLVVKYTMLVRLAAEFVKRGILKKS